MGGEELLGPAVKISEHPGLITSLPTCSQARIRRMFDNNRIVGILNSLLVISIAAFNNLFHGLETPKNCQAEYWHIASY